MADMIARLKIDSSEYDSKVKRAADGILHLEKTIRVAGESFIQTWKDEQDFAKGLGQMETVSRTARGKISELTSAFTEMSLVYKRMTDEEKESPFGRGLKDSLDQLKTRISDAKKDLADVNKELNGLGNEGRGAGGVLDALKDKLTINVDALKLLNVGLSGAKAALDVAKDAFFSNEEQLDEWGRIVESSKSLYNGFLDALNTGDISGYIQSIDNIVQAARDAYDALDELNTFNAFNQRNVARTHRSLTESIADFREGKSTKEDVRAAGNAYKAELKQRMKLENEAYVEAVNNLAQQRGVSAKDLMKALSGEYGDYKKLKETPLTGVKSSLQFLGPGQAQTVTTAIPANDTEKLGAVLRRLNDTELQSLQALGAQADRTGDEIAQVDRQLSRLLNRKSSGSSGGSGNGGGNTTKELTPLQEVQKQITDLSNEALTADKERQDAIKEQIALLQKEAEEYKKIQDYVQGKGTASELFPDVDIPKGDSLTPFEQLQDSIRTKLSDQAAIVDENTMRTTLTVAIQNGIDSLNPDFTELQERMGEGMDIPDSAWEALVEKINEKLAELNIDPIKINFETGDLINPDSIKNVNDELKISVKQAQLAGNAFSQLGSAISKTGDESANIAGLVMQAIGNVISAFGMAQMQSVSQGPWAWISFAVTGLATMITTIASIKNAAKGGFAQGGIVPGNSFSGDNLRTSDYGINSGELILSKVQQNTLASMLETPAYYGGGNSTISGEQIVTVVNAFGRRTGRGEILT